MSVLLIQNWDIIQGKEDEYTRYVNDIYLPEITTLGFIPVGGYYVEVGFGPRILAVFSSESLDDISRIIAGKDFRAITLKLKNFVCNYRNTVLESTGSVKRAKYPIQKGVWKYNQYYDLRPGVKSAYANFVINEHLPTMKKIDFLEVTGGWNVLLGGFCEIIAEFTFKDPEDIGRLMKNEDFRRVTRKLKNEFVTNYSNRVLRSTESFDEPKWFKL
ncbi:MAG TPA: hypothetical protein PLX88_07815 [Syntrophorhabdaceae bacterium]|jgi:hypothetical protein|nr:hypothetical protein [Syntrophorhabdaceae bacterium]MDI9562144.1 hypothetical protein [Pseudomonadota bacterium]OQC51945.1 MAG: hypothetical protein BWX58_00178 [Deltaproteobacteria bacterium ADurb.Bin026]HNQ64252.1 hypothetical protein [Syntrophorhabdaceae bacterium]HNZ59620.1 hypothetical protein [Syntrophorhabdaceae bacterium]